VYAKIIHVSYWSRTINSRDPLLKSYGRKKHIYIAFIYT